MVGCTDLSARACATNEKDVEFMYACALHDSSIQAVRQAGQGELCGLLSDILPYTERSFTVRSGYRSGSFVCT